MIPVPMSDLLVFDISRTEEPGAFSRAEMEALDAYRPAFCLAIHPDPGPRRASRY